MDIEILFMEKKLLILRLLVIHFVRFFYKSIYSDLLTLFIQRLTYRHGCVDIIIKKSLADNFSI